MTSFEYVMVLVSIVIALAIAHLLTALSECVRRMRGKGEPNNDVWIAQYPLLAELRRSLGLR